MRKFPLSAGPAAIWGYFTLPAYPGRKRRFPRKVPFHTASSAICWARIPVLVFGATRFDAAAEGVEFSDAAIYEEMALAYGERGAFRKILQGESSYSLDAFNYWKRSEKIEY